jgi:hypothetical protein
VAEPTDDGDLVEIEPVVVIGQRVGELVDVPEILDRMVAEDPHVQLAAGLVAKLEGESRPLSGGFEPAGIARVGRAAGGELAARSCCHGNRRCVWRQVAKAG